MLSLHVVTEDVRATAKWGLVGFVVLILLIIVFNVAKGILIKPKVVLPTVSFGVLPAIPFPQSTITQHLNYTLDTVDGRASIIDPATNQAVVVPDRINIYKLIHQTPSLISLQTARNKVFAAGFVDPTDPTRAVQETRLSDIEYNWETATGLPRSISMNITTNNFYLTSEFMTYPAVLSTSNAPTDSDAQTIAQNMLNAMQLFPSDINSSLTTTTDYVIANGVLRQASPGENVMAVRVNFFQNAVNQYPIVYPNVPNTTISFLVTGGDTSPTVAQATFVHQIIDTSTFGTYPLKTPDQAYAELQAGKGYITPSFTGIESVKIQTINLGYYLGENSQDYLMPVYIFQGDGNFIGYVSAVSSTEISSATPNPTRGL